MSDSSPIVVLLCTTPPDAASRLARFLVENRLAACVNVVERVTSFYWWEGELCEDGESLLVIKTPRSEIEELTAKLVEEHPYTVPEVIALPVVDGNEKYIDWVFESTRR